VYCDASCILALAVQRVQSTISSDPIAKDTVWHTLCHVPISFMSVHPPIRVSQNIVMASWSRSPYRAEKCQLAGTNPVVPNLRSRKGVYDGIEFVYLPPSYVL